MSTEPTQPTRPPEPAGSASPAEAAPETAQHPTAGSPGDWSWATPQAAAPKEAAAPQPSFTPAQPSFTPVQAGQASQAGQAGQAGQPGQGGEPGEPQDFQQGNWPDQPPQYTSPHGWPQVQPPYDAGGAPGGGPVGAATAGPGGRLGYPAGRPPRRRGRSRRWVMALFTIIVLLILATIGDRVANAIAENTVANQMVKNGFPVKPSVTIEGFPFLTQVVAHDIQKIDISAVNVPAGPVTITSVKGTLTGVHLNSSFNGGTVDHIVGTVFVSFASLASAGGGGTETGITMTADGPDRVKITAGLGPVSDTEVAKVTRTGNEVSVQVENGSSPLSGLLSSFGSFSFTIPKLPAGLEITTVAVTQQGIVVSAAGNHTTLTEPGS